MSTAHPLDRIWRIESLLAQLYAAFAPIDDEENEGYFDGIAEFIDRDDDDEDEDDADDYLNKDEEEDLDDDDLG